jgi:hypothetical protein
VEVVCEFDQLICLFRREGHEARGDGIWLRVGLEAKLGGHAKRLAGTSYCPEQIWVLVL